MLHHISLSFSLNAINQWRWLRHQRFFLWRRRRRNREWSTHTSSCCTEIRERLTTTTSWFLPHLGGAWQGLAVCVRDLRTPTSGMSGMWNSRETPTLSPSASGRHFFRKQSWWQQFLSINLWWKVIYCFYFNLKENEFAFLNISLKIFSVKQVIKTKHFFQKNYCIEYVG